LKYLTSAHELGHDATDSRRSEAGTGNIVSLMYGKGARNQSA